jgi:hypothetical protein
VTDVIPQLSRDDARPQSQKTTSGAYSLKYY